MPADDVSSGWPALHGSLSRERHWILDVATWGTRPPVAVITSISAIADRPRDVLCGFEYIVTSALFDTVRIVTNHPVWELTEWDIRPCECCLVPGDDVDMLTVLVVVLASVCPSQVPPKSISMRSISRSVCYVQHSIHYTVHCSPLSLFISISYFICSMVFLPRDAMQTELT